VTLTISSADLKAAFEDARNEAAVRRVILTGAGGKAFIAGADIRELAHATALDAEQSSRFRQGVLDLIENLGKPVIAAVDSFAMTSKDWGDAMGCMGINHSRRVRTAEGTPNPCERDFFVARSGAHLYPLGGDQIVLFGGWQRDRGWRTPRPPSPNVASPRYKATVCCSQVVGHGRTGHHEETDIFGTTEGKASVRAAPDCRPLNGCRGRPYL
jgi:hypothetical protein